MHLPPKGICNTKYFHDVRAVLLAQSMHSSCLKLIMKSAYGGHSADHLCFWWFRFSKESVTAHAARCNVAIFM